jgi:hypothetical protein
MIKKRAFIPGKLYKFVNNTAYFDMCLWHPQTTLSNKIGKEFVEPINENTKLYPDSIFMYVGQIIGPDISGDILHKILYKDQIYYAFLFEPGAEINGPL